MNAFVFKPSNELIGKFFVRDSDSIPDGLRRFLADHDPVPPDSYVELSGRKWTIASTEPCRLEEVLAAPPASQGGTASAAKRSALARCAIWSGALTIGLPLLWVVLVEGLGHAGNGNAALGLGWFGALGIIVGVPIGIIVTLGLAIAAAVAASKRKEDARAKL